MGKEKNSSQEKRGRIICGTEENILHLQPQFEKRHVWIDKIARVKV